MCNPKSATAGCIAGVLRRLLCSSSLPTYPADHILETYSVQCDIQLKGKEGTEPKVTPSIVARLMGLDSIPATQMTTNSVVRSRSMNSADYPPERDRMHVSHRRVKTSLSFREVPAFLEKEDEDFFILSFENEGGSETGEQRSKGTKSEMGFGELKQRRAERCRNKENKTESLPKKKNKEDQETIKMVLIEEQKKTKLREASEIIKPSKPINRKKVRDGEKLRKRKKNHSAVGKLVSECSDTEDSSPVSVLDFDDFLVDFQIHTSEEDSRSSPEPEHASNLISDVTERKTIEGKCKKGRQSDNYSEIWIEICRLTEGEMRESNWKYRELWKLEDIYADFGVHIFDRLLNELVVDQLGEHPLMDFDS